MVLEATEMTVYKVFYLYKNEEPIRGEFMGALMERRKNWRGRSRVQSGLIWARLAFGDKVEDRDSLYVLPEDLNFKNDTVLPVGKKILDRDEYLWMIEAVEPGAWWEREENHSLRFIN